MPATSTFPTVGSRAARPGGKAARYVGGVLALLLLLCFGGLALIGAFASDPQQTEPIIGAQPAAPTNAVADLDRTELTRSTPTVAPPLRTTRTVTETQAIPYKTRTAENPALAKGTKKTLTKGVAGVKTLTYEVTYTDGVETGRRLTRQETTLRPVTKVVAVGTKIAPKPASNCDSNYSGCVPIASDVDCAGGSGDGPKYVSGVVRVIGEDIYDLDRDNDGLGCDMD
jgi:hypothetical protein